MWTQKSVMQCKQNISHLYQPVITASTQQIHLCANFHSCDIASISVVLHQKFCADLSVTILLPCDDSTNVVTNPQHLSILRQLNMIVHKATAILPQIASLIPTTPAHSCGCLQTKPRQTCKSNTKTLK